MMAFSIITKLQHSDYIKFMKSSVFFTLMLNVVMLSVAMLTVMTPLSLWRLKKKKCFEKKKNPFHN
jgi:hypothetical protein